MRRSFAMLFVLVAVGLHADPFKPGCTTFPLPHMNTIMKPQPFDPTCGNDGDVKAGDPKALQNESKNNLCAEGSPVLLTSVTFDQLQAHTGNLADPPSDRAPLRNITVASEPKPLGEGTLVTFVAYVQKAKYSDLGNGESVNCNRPDEPQNDMHIAVVDDPTTTDECASMTVEMIPHYRPLAWTPVNFHFLSLFTPDPGHHAYTDYVTKNRPRVRVTGQLFFDASHKVCSGGKALSGNPARRSNWEIHPVYAVDVCTQSHCDPATSAGWEAFDTWITHAPTTNAATKPAATPPKTTTH